MEETSILKIVINTLFIAVLASIITAYPVMLLWNYALAPAVSGINPIGFWQSLGIVVLCSILFKSHGQSLKKD